MEIPKATASSDSFSDPIVKLGRTPTLEMPRLLVAAGENSGVLLCRSMGIYGGGEGVPSTPWRLSDSPCMTYVLTAVTWSQSSLQSAVCIEFLSAKPTPIDRLKQKASLESSYYQHFDVLYIRDKLPKLDPDVAIRLGKMITRRRQMLYYREAHGKGLDISRVQPKLPLPSASASKPFTLEANMEPQHVLSRSQVAMSWAVSSHFTLRSTYKSYHGAARRSPFSGCRG
jgi:hypothetical protein